MDNLSLNLEYNRGLAGFLKGLFGKKKADVNLLEMQEQQRLLDDMKKTKLELEGIQRFFNYVCDPDLIEYAIYQEYAIKLKYSYLVKQAKEKNIKSINFLAV